MTDDLLKRASAALRDETAEADEGARFTRARVLASLQQSQVRRRSRLALLLPLAACFAAASAFGMVSGQVPAFVRSVTHSLGNTFAPTPPAAPAPRKRTAAPSAPTAAPVTEPAPIAAPPESPAPSAVPAVPAVPAKARPSAPEPDRTPRLKERVAPLAKSPAVAPEAPRNTPPAVPSQAPLTDVSDRAHELYRVAHRTHFVDHDFVSALRAWDAYLEAAPSGRFVLEARYNRALCLVRLGRSGEARDALTPFANGKFGGYRQAEAKALIDAING